MKRIFASVIPIFTLIFILLFATACGAEQNDNKKMDEIILLIDASYSASSAKDEVDSLVESVIQSSTEAKIGIVTFGYDQVYVVPLTRDTTDMYAKYLHAPLPDTTATDIAAAIQYAASLCTPGARSKIVLISDGAETDGVSTAAATVAAANGIIVDTICCAREIEENEAQIISLVVPENIVIGQSFTATATIQSSFSGKATITPSDNGIAGTEQQIELVRGLQTVEIPYTLVLPGLHKLSVEMESNSDTLALNNIYNSCIYIPSFSNILVIESIADESESLRDMLSEDLEVSVVNVSDSDMMPRTIDEIREYDQVILCNISYSDMPVGFDELLYSYVYDFGGGLFTICGNKEDTDSSDDEWTTNAYTKEDMFGTVYQQLLPVEIIDYTPPTAVIIIIDNSISMLSYHPEDENDTPFFYAKLGAKACLDTLSASDYVGIMSLSDAYTKPFELIPRTQRDKILSSIENMESGDRLPLNALEFERAGEALLELDEVEERHIIFVTDGNFSSIDMNAYQDCLQENAEHGITMSIVGIGCTRENENKMRELVKYAQMPEKNFYNITDATAIPNIMRNDLSSPEIRDVEYRAFQPTFGMTHMITSGINEENLPALYGFYGVKAKKGADVIINGEYTPIYAQWQCGLGMVGTFACDLNGTFSADFISSMEGEKLINNIVKNLLPTKDIRPAPFDVTINGDNYSQMINVITDLEEGQYIEVTVTDISDDNNTEEIQRFTSNEINNRMVFAFKAGICQITVQKKDASGILLASADYFKVFSYSKEYDAFYDRESASDNLAKIAQCGKGKVIKSTADVFSFEAQNEDK
ncbi:MAG: VWA domain-containing protein [Clostridia bacterium]|nr:VWA domain-containing protein [Clostridia bacterium]